MTFSIRWESNGKRKRPYYGKSISTNFPISLPYHGFSLGFLVLWEIEGKTHAFPIWWSGSNGKIHSYYGKSMGTNFPGFPHLRVSLHFPYMTNRRENTCIFHMAFSHVNFPYIILEDGNPMEIKLILCKLYVN